LSIDELYQEDVQKVLQWLCFCARPVTLSEMVEVLAVTIKDGPRFDSDERYAEPRDILTRCSSLVSISKLTPGHPSLWDPDEDQLTLAHFSVKEYLMSERIQISAACRYHVTEKCANILIAQICLAYLLQFNTKDCLNKSTIRNYPLADYAALYWIKHACPQGGTELTELQPLIMELLQASRNPYLNWLQIYETNPQFGMGTPLYYSSQAGLLDTTNLLLQQGADVNTQGGLYSNALQAASAMGHEPVTRLLLEKGAEVNAQGGIYGNALQAASLCGEKTVVCLLLEQGAEINAQGGLYGNALQAASLAGGKEIMHLLLEKGAEVNMQGGLYGSALQAAAVGGQEVIIRLLLEKGAEVNTQVGFYGNALQAAAAYDQETIVRLLLEKGAQVNARGGFYGSALQAASEMGREIIVRLLLQEGADIRVMEPPSDKLQVLDQEEIVSLLLEKGAEISAQRQSLRVSGMTPEASADEERCGSTL
jgi:ankyrin repeat protein